MSGTSSVFERFRLEVRTSVMAGARRSSLSDMSGLHECQRRTRKHSTVNMGVVSKRCFHASRTRWFVFVEERARLRISQTFVQFSATQRGKMPVHACFRMPNSVPRLFTPRIYIQHTPVEQQQSCSHISFSSNPHPRKHVDALAVSSQFS